MQYRSLFAVVAAAWVLAACAPRRPMTPAPAPAPPPPVEAPVEADAARTARAQRAWEQGTAMGRQGRWVDAETHYRQAAAARPDSSVYHMALANALLQQGKRDAAADAMLAAIRIDERKSPPNHRVLAVDYERLIGLLESLNRLDEARAARERQRFHRMMRDTATPR
jgi:tetratricopeptide (TPR) repeat protein